MSVDVIMPQMGESIAEGTVTRWLKKVGDAVKRDEPLFEISTDKVDAEIPAPSAGTLAEILVGEGKTVGINTVVGRIAASGEAVVAAAPAPAPAPPAPAAAGAKAAAPAAPASSGPSSGNGGSVATAGLVSKDELRRTRSSPLVRKIASEHGVDISTIAGTGLSGRVTRQDILGYVARSGSAAPGGIPAGASAPQVKAPAVPSVFRPGESSRIEPMSAMRRKIAEHMVMSRRTSAHVTTFFEVDMTGVARLREKHKAAFSAREGISLTYMPFIAKAAVEAIRSHPIINASVDGDNIVYKRDVNLGIAVALDWGLIVPVIRKADEKNLLGLSRAITDLAERARTKRLSPDEAAGGTFTITNPGAFGGLIGTPIINQPQVAILGVGVIEKRPVVINDAIAIRTMCYLALSFDHRIVDGADAERFMVDVKAILQTAAFPDLGT